MQSVASARKQAVMLLDIVYSHAIASRIVQAHAAAKPVYLYNTRCRTCRCSRQTAMRAHAHKRQIVGTPSRVLSSNAFFCALAPPLGEIHALFHELQTARLHAPCRLGALSRRARDRVLRARGARRLGPRPEISRRDLDACARASWAAGGPLPRPAWARLSPSRPARRRVA